MSSSSCMAKRYSKEEAKKKFIKENKSIIGE
jgi:hypothetical protein